MLPYLHVAFPLILCDLDGPLADLEGAFLGRWQEQFPGEFFIPLGDRKTFFLHDEYPEHLKEKMASIMRADGFFLDLPANPHGIQAVQEMHARGYKVIICTSDIYTNKTGLADKRAWVAHHLGHEYARSMIFARDKTLVRGNYLIDDKPVITGALMPEWQNIIFDQPFNREITDKPRIHMDWSNWEEVLGHPIVPGKTSE